MSVSSSRARDLSSWLTKREAAAALHCSEKSIERHVQRGKLEQRRRPVEGRAPVTVFSPGDVAALGRALGVGSPEVLPAVVGAAGSVSPRLGPFSSLPPRDPGDGAVYVSLSAAVRIVGLSQSTIRDLAAAGAVKTMPYGRGFRYRRADLLAL